MASRVVLLRVVFSLMILGGCASTPKADLTQFNQSREAIYPSISIITTSEELQYPERRRSFLEAIKESNVFKSIDINNPYSDFAMEVYLETKSRGMDNAEGFAKGIIIGGTLGFVPVGVSFSSNWRVKMLASSVATEKLPKQF